MTELFSFFDHLGDRYFETLRTILNDDCNQHFILIIA